MRRVNKIFYILFQLFTVIYSLNIKMSINNDNNNNNYNLPIKKLENGESKHLVLLNYEITSEWCKNWLYEMSLYMKEGDSEHPQFMFSDIMNMRIYCELNKEDQNIYIGFLSLNPDTKNEPLYIGAFKSIKGKRIINIERIIQNPKNTLEYASVIDFRNALYELGEDSYCNINIESLKNFSNDRYWFEFKFF